MTAQFVFYNKDGQVLEYTTCKGLEVGHSDLINARGSDTMNTQHMEWYSQMVHKYLQDLYPFSLEGGDMEDWKYTPNLDQLIQLVNNQNYDALIDFYEGEVEKINYFSEETNLWNLWKLRNIKDMMAKYSLIEGSYAMFNY
jgi:hypothetical protein